MFPSASSTKSSRPIGPALWLLAMVIGCGGPTESRTVTAAELDALPRLSISDGATLCASGTPADTVCPFQVATGNWLAPDAFAVWETGRPVQIWIGGKPTILLAKDTAASSQYHAATGVGPGKTKDEVVVLDAIAAVAHRFKTDGTHLDAKTLSPMTQLSIWGYYGAIPVWQVMETSADHLTADVVIRVGKELGDEKAREAFRANLPWLHLLNGSVTMAPPLFPNSVLYAFTQNGDVIWSDGARFVIERDRPNGKAVWKLASDITGPPVDSIDIARKYEDLKGPSGLLLPPGMFDSMKVRTIGTKHPALNGVMIDPGGQVLVARTVLPQRDSIDYVRMSGEGLPNAQFTLPKSAQLVLFAGDSVLVHRTVDNEPKILIWLYLKK